MIRKITFFYADQEESSFRRQLNLKASTRWRVIARNGLAGYRVRLKMDGSAFIGFVHI